LHRGLVPVYNEKSVPKSINSMQWIIVGLGNPGKAYANHRHNVGFWAADMLQKHWSCAPWILKKEALLTQGMVGDDKIILCCPQTFMNLSGAAVAPLFRHYPRAQFLIIHDELDLPCGQLRFKKGGSAGGHNGLKSIHQVLGPDYWRIRIGIDRPSEKAHVSEYVLHSFHPAEREKILISLDRLRDAMDVLIAGDEKAFIQGLQAP
jgi:PTH1 family peptidyl-tRNA hydrolase